MNESMDRLLADWLREGPESGPREGLDRALGATRRVGQRPGWTFPERWLPMQLTLARTPSLRPLLAIAIPALLLVAIVAAALFIGASRPRVPQPFGPARNGALVYAADGDLYIAEGPAQAARPLVAGPESDSAPLFSNQGDRLAFAREAEGAVLLMSIAPDGTGLTELARLPGEHNGFSWAPDGSSIIVNHSESGLAGLRLTVVSADGTSSRTLDVDWAADYASWRPDGRQILFRGHDLMAGTSSSFIADADGTNVRRLDIETSQDVDFEGLGWSPDGQHISFMSDGSLGGTSGWQINIADINPEGEVTALQRLKLDPESTGEHLPVWSPDSTQIAFLLEKYSKRQVGIVNADGTGYHVVGPETWANNILSYAWSPDGKTLLITEFPESELIREANRRTWSVDLASGRQTEVETPVATWQRLAP